MTVKEYCESCQNKGSHKCHSCLGKYYDGVLQGKPTKYAEKPQTNADRIRAMSDEELISFFVLEDKCPKNISNRECDGFESCKDCWVHWLKQPAEVSL